MASYETCRSSSSPHYIVRPCQCDSHNWDTTRWMASQSEWWVCPGRSWRRVHVVRACHDSDWGSCASPDWSRVDSSGSDLCVHPAKLNAFTLFRSIIATYHFRFLLTVCFRFLDCCWCSCFHFSHWFRSFSHFLHFGMTKQCAELMNKSFAVVVNCY